jgi:hypothetical protein
MAPRKPLAAAAAALAAAATGVSAQWTCPRTGAIPASATGWGWWEQLPPAGAEAFFTVSGVTEDVFFISSASAAVQHWCAAQANVSAKSGDGTVLFTVDGVPPALEGCGLLYTTATDPALVKNVSYAVGGWAACPAPGKVDSSALLNFTSPAVAPIPQPLACAAPAAPVPAGLAGYGDYAAVAGTLGFSGTNMTIAQLGGWMLNTVCILNATVVGGARTPSGGPVFQVWGGSVVLGYPVALGCYWLGVDAAAGTALWVAGPSSAYASDATAAAGAAGGRWSLPRVTVVAGAPAVMGGAAPAGPSCPASLDGAITLTGWTAL